MSSSSFLIWGAVPTQSACEPVSAWAKSLLYGAHLTTPQAILPTLRRERIRFHCNPR